MKYFTIILLCMLLYFINHNAYCYNFFHCLIVGYYETFWYTTNYNFWYLVTLLTIEKMDEKPQNILKIKSKTPIVEYIILLYFTDHENYRIRKLVSLLLAATNRYNYIVFRLMVIFQFQFFSF